ncbi:hypothetical protein DYB31_011451 [Aphanomyces astaci]|uniref:Uncharacterized protein n=2 Tax=Aphanomyces astaci TaxID=112090 RepID=A0A397EYG9_APHAT|nr:hypothetical protein DYB31_011451 [Aphanomyces astaci]
MPPARVYATEPKRRKWTWAHGRKWWRVISNLLAIFLILLTGLTVVVLLAKGMFFSRLASPYFQTSTDWKPYNQTCRLSPDGFVAASCSAEEVAFTLSPEAWHSIGWQLASDIQVPSATVAAYVTTCVIGTRREWVGVAMLVGEFGFPQCLPVGEQVILGMALLETATTATYPDGAYLLSSFSGMKQTHNMTELALSDGTVAMAFAPMVKTLVSTDGVTSMAHRRQPNYRTTLNSLNQRYLMEMISVAEYIDISSVVSTQSGWSVGSRNRFVGTFAWDTQHKVSNYEELLVFQIAIALAALCLLANDGIITLEGLSGLLKDRPVLTYDLFSALERRKLLLVFLVWTMMFSPLYADVLRYLHLVAGNGPWDLSLIMVASLFAWSWMGVLTCVQHVPCPVAWRHRPLAYSAPVFVNTNLALFLGLQMAKDRGFVEFFEFWADAHPLLGIQVHSVAMNAGAYGLDGTTPVIYKLLPDIAMCLGISWVVSIISAASSNGWDCRLDTAWTAHNSFLQSVGVPRWVTCMSLDKRNAIPIGKDKLYCKPSTLVLMGYTSVHSAAVMSMNTNAREENHAMEHFVLGIYDLIRAIMPVLRRRRPPRVHGTIQHNAFLSAKSTVTLDATRTFVYSRGECCG